MMNASLATMLQYRGEIVLWALWGVVFPAVSMAMWRVAGKGQGVGAFSQGDIAAYFLLTMFVGHVTAAWDIFEIGHYVQSGLLSPKLLRPMLPIWESLADNIAYKVLTLVILLPLWIGVGLAVRPTFHTRAVDLLLGVPALLMAAVIAFVWGYVVSCLAFYITRMDAVGELYYGAMLVFGGRFAAIEWLPGPLAAITWLLPFRWMLAFPSELLMGRLDAAATWTGLAWQAAWLAAGILAFRRAWRRGVRHYSAVGA